MAIVLEHRKKKRPPLSLKISANFDRTQREIEHEIDRMITDCRHSSAFREGRIEGGAHAPARQWRIIKGGIKHLLQPHTAAFPILPGHTSGANAMPAG